jgi:hypothetical protein
MPLQFVSPDWQSRQLALPSPRQPSGHAVVSDHWPELLQFSTWLASHRSDPGAQSPLQIPLTHAWLWQSPSPVHVHTPLLQVVGDWHTTPHAPQLAESLLVSEQEPEQFI